MLRRTDIIVEESVLVVVGGAGSAWQAQGGGADVGGDVLPGRVADGAVSSSVAVWSTWSRAEVPPLVVQSSAKIGF